MLHREKTPSWTGSSEKNALWVDANNEYYPLLFSILEKGNYRCTIIKDSKWNTAKRSTNWWFKVKKLQKRAVNSVTILTLFHNSNGVRHVTSLRLPKVLHIIWVFCLPISLFDKPKNRRSIERRQLCIGRICVRMFDLWSWLNSLHLLNE